MRYNFHREHRIPLLLGLLAAVSLAFTVSIAGAEGPYQEEQSIGHTFSNLRDVTDHYEYYGYLLLGRFNNVQWPATVVYEKESLDEISFVLKNGSPHSYPGYDGYRLKVVALEDAYGSEIMLVFRSKEKEINK